ncbi:tether containing UBX domain for GLUT4 [Leguminivora glycinivorella]|uniref:tether containing UBX domain for GLUT4 n=1 Tax=Leguminivora glycinivorella TaxID=1035111 RepID=UPI002010BDF5|nr:tether containing UBX domain for GLUT4 [Leguminivora glycinivorella]
MSKDLVVLTPNGRRQKVHCTPNTSFLQVLEDVCEKQGFQPDEYGLKHYNQIIDLTSTLRWSNIPNKATLEMVESDRSRHETNVTIGLQFADGERRTADFAPNTSLFDLVNSMAPEELKTLTHPTVLYMRHEITGVPALKEKTLRQLGLIGGRAILRLLNKAENATQANVSTVYRRPFPPKEEKENQERKPSTPEENNTAGPSNAQPSNVHKTAFTKSTNPIDLIKKQKERVEKQKVETTAEPAETVVTEPPSKNNESMEVDEVVSNTNSATSVSSENLERRLMIEEEVTFLGSQKAIIFTPKEEQEELDDLPDDFYELSVEEVRRLFRDLQQNRLQLENTPLLTSTKKEEMEKQSSEQRLAQYKSAVVRIQFPDHVILQGIFSPDNTIGDIYNFIKDYLETPDKPFTTFVTPLKETLDPNMTLLEAKFVPCVHMHFKWLQEEANPKYLKKELYLKKTASDAASILASKYRAPNRRKPPSSNPRTSDTGASSSKNSKVPKWFKK